jgi:hypothetical protein
MKLAHQALLVAKSILIDGVQVDGDRAKVDHLSVHVGKWSNGPGFHYNSVIVCLVSFEMSTTVWYGC